MKLFAIVVLSLSFAAPSFAEQGALSVLLAGTAAQKNFSVPEIPPVSMPSDRDGDSPVLDLDLNSANILADTAREDGYAVLELNGASMTTKRAIMAHTAQQLRLPMVPENWDALIDLIADLPEIHGNTHILVVVRNAGRIKAASPQLYEDFRDVAEFSAKKAREYSKNAVRLTFVFVN